MGNVDFREKETRTFHHSCCVWSDNVFLGQIRDVNPDWNSGCHQAATSQSSVPTRCCCPMVWQGCRAAPGEGRVVLHQQSSGLGHSDANVHPCPATTALLLGKAGHFTANTNTARSPGQVKVKQSKRGIHVSPVRAVPSLTSGLASVHLPLAQNSGRGKCWCPWPLCCAVLMAYECFSYMSSAVFVEKEKTPHGLQQIVL